MPAGGATGSAADTPTLTARAVVREARVGDAIRVEITAIGAATTPVNLPSTLDLAPFSLLERSEDDTDLGDGRRRRRFVISVAAYVPGDAVIPSVPVTYLAADGAVKTVATDPIPIKIVSVLANEAEPTLRPNRPPVVVLEPNHTPLYVAGALLAAALGALVAVFVRRRLRRVRAQRPAPPPRPPHEVALEKLDRLGASGFSDGIDQRPFVFALSEIVREYLGARFGFDALELTTEELVEALRRHAGRELVLAEAEGFLASCDLVKFAKQAPSATEARGAFETAIRLVEATRPRPAPPLPAAAPPPPTAHAA